MKLLHYLILLKCCFISCLIQAQNNNQWVWMKGDNIANQASNHGVLGVSAPTNKPGARYEALEWKDQQGNFWLFGGQKGTGTGSTWNDLWKYNPLTNDWTWINGDNISGQPGVYGVKGVPDPANKPGFRGLASCSWVDSSGNLWLFGGVSIGISGFSGKINDLWMYNIGTNEWTWMHGSNVAGQSPIYGIKGVADPANTPGARHETSCTWVDNSGNLWLFGGSMGGGTGPYANDLWKYDIATNEWTWMSGDNITNQTGVYGTQGTPSLLNKPGARMVYASWKDNNGDLWFFGGHGYASTGEGKLNDLWKYNIATDEWTWMSGSDTANQAGVYGSLCVPSTTNIPGGRHETRARWVDACGNFWLFGGFNNGSFNDLWRYNVTSNEWTWISGDSVSNQSGVYGVMGVPDPANKPGARNGAVGWINDDGLWLWGGFAVSNYNNDLWKYIPDTPSVGFTYVDSLICSNLTITNFTDTSASNCSGDIKSYLWDFGDPLSGVNNTSDLPNPSHQYNNEGTYNVKLVITTCLGIEDSVTQSVTVNFQPPVTLGNDTIICPGDILVLDAGSPGNTYLWSTNETTQTINASSAAIYWVDVTKGLCTDRDSINISFKLEQIDLGGDVSLCDVFPDKLILNAGYDTSAIYLWSNGVTTSSIEVTEPGIYWVEKQLDNCILRDTIEVTGNMGSSGLYLPNSFTPNTDGLNEVFTAYGEEVTYFQMQIFNRWGELLYQTEDINKGWDGKYKDELVSIGIYLWTVDYKLGCTGEEVLHKTGHVLLK